MLHPDSLSDEAKARYQTLLDEAEQWRLEQRVLKGRSLLRERLRLALGERLIAWGRQLQTSAPPAPQLE